MTSDIARARRHSSCDAVEAGFEVALAAQTDDLVGDLAVMEKQKRWNCANAIFAPERLLKVNVHFTDFHAASVFVSEFIQNGRDHFARAAPFGPKINEDGHGRFQNFLGEIFPGE